jgi:hypothetical protein
MPKQATRQQIENDLQRAVTQRQRELDGAAEGNREERQQAFLAALQAYTAFVADGKVPEGYLLIGSDYEEDDDEL